MWRYMTIQEKWLAFDGDRPKYMRMIWDYLNLNRRRADRGEPALALGSYTIKHQSQGMYAYLRRHLEEMTQAGMVTRVITPRGGTAYVIADGVSMDVGRLEVPDR